MTRTTIVAACVAALLAVSPAASGREKIAPERTAGELVLFDAATHGNEVISNGTWPGGDLRPVSEIVRKAGKTYAEFSFQGTHGRARTVLAYEPLREPEEGMRYAGIKLM